MQIHEDHDRRQSHINEPFVSNNIVASSSSSPSSLSCHSLFHSTQQHDAGYNYHQEDDNYAYNQSGSSSSSHDMIKNKNENKLWEKESEAEKNNYPVKWMSSKMRLKYNPTKVEEDHEKLVLGSSMDLSSSANMMSCSYNNININNNNNNNVIRVCSDCSTTKTPLWRSGPKGPKSLCNACGIRQRKARRASGMAVVSDEPPAHIKEIKNTTTTTTTTTTTNSVGKINYNASSTIQLRKRFMKMTTSAAGSTSIGAGTPSIYNGPKKIEEFLIHFSNSLAASQLRVCPEDEKDAAILLMALSSGLFHTN